MYKRLIVISLFVLLIAISIGGNVAPSVQAATDKIAFESTRNGAGTDPIYDDIYTMNPDSTGTTRLTTSSDYDGAPCWSPDGGQIVFESWRDTGRNHEIYVMDSDGNNQINITNNAAADEAPAWSPNGQKIAFHSYRDSQYEIYTMSPNGTGVTRLTTNGGNYEPAWSPDSSTIVYESNGDIYVMDANGSNSTRLTTASGRDSWPAWSPDGNKIVFVSERDGNKEIYVMNTDGSSQTNLTQSTANDWYPAWSQDSSKIIFQSNRDGNYELYEMNADGSRQTRLTVNSAYDETPVYNISSQSSTGSWATGVSMNSGRWLFGMTTLNGKIYAAGGWGLQTAEEYPVNNTWQNLANNMNYGGYYLSLVALNGKLYALGDGTDVIEEYDPNTGYWTVAGYMTIARYGPGVAVSNGKIYIFGGYNGSSTCYTSVEEFTPGGSSTVVTNLSYGRWLMGAVTAPDGKIYIIGGDTSWSSTPVSVDTVEVYDPYTNTWSTQKASIPTARCAFGCVYYNGLIYAIGGYANTIGITNKVEAYSPAFDTWVSKADLSSVRCGPGAAVLNGNIYVSGGCLDLVGSSVLQDTEVFTP
jgi:Tol biopolymer transport system component